MPKDSIPFRGFDERGDIRIYDHGILPHWRQPGCTYFVTFRLADSIPQSVFKEIEHERVTWLRARGRLPSDEKRLYERLLGRLLNKSLDECHGSCSLRPPEIAGEVAGALDHFHGTRVWTGDFVVMPNHVHVLLTPINGFELEDILHSIKSYTATKLNRQLHRTGAFWQRESHDHIVRDLEQLGAYQEYIAANPAKAKLREGEYILSCAKYHVVGA
jgi:putative transposase